MAQTEAVNHPGHYGGDGTYEVFKVIEAWGLDDDAYLFNVVKYIARCRKKGGFLEDLKKARVYLDRRIARLEAHTVYEDIMDKLTRSDEGPVGV